MTTTKGFPSVSIKFTYISLGQTPFIDNDGNRCPLPGVRIYGVRAGEGADRRVLGLVQANPSPGLPNQWRAVAAIDPRRFPKVDFDRGLWEMTPGRSGFGSKREAAVWMLGVSDTMQTWFKDAELEAVVSHVRQGA